MTSKSPVQITTQLNGKNITLSADSPEEMKVLTSQLLDVGDDIVSNLIAIDQVIMGKTVMSTPVGAPDNPGRGGPGVSTPPPSGDNVGSCPHGQMVLRGGESSRGTWQAYFCPLPKDDPGKCTPIDAKTGRAWKTR